MLTLAFDIFIPALCDIGKNIKMFEGSIVLTKSVCEPINWNKYGGWFQDASPIPLLEAVNLLKENRLQLPKLSLVGKVFRRWPFYSDITGELVLCT